MAYAHGLDERRAGNRRSASAIDHDLDVLELASGQQHGIDEACSRDDRRAMLIVVHDGYFHSLL